MPPSDQPVDRRRFFREGLRELLRPLADVVEPLEQVIQQITDLDSVGAPTPAPAHRPAYDAWLRPPGALPEQRFLDACSRCGDCVRVCPAQCIKIDSTGERGGGAPFIDLDVMPCVVCDGLQCTHVCPTGALAPIPLGAIDMGTAVWRPATCVRSQGEPCTICIDRCPVGAVAIELVGDDVQVHPDGCIGCGVCQYYCPTTPKSIVVIPRAARET
jgi:MauM/NapG family ferredoxin protein